MVLALLALGDHEHRQRNQQARNEQPEEQHKEHADHSSADHSSSHHSADPAHATATQARDKQHRNTAPAKIPETVSLFFLMRRSFVPRSSFFRSLGSV